MTTKTKTPDEVAVPKRPVPPNLVCIRCAAPSPDVYDTGDGPYCSWGCVELTRRGL
jgi:hypothetical protein